MPNHNKNRTSKQSAKSSDGRLPSFEERMDKIVPDTSRDAPLPTGRHLSKAPSKESNDPLYEQAFVPSPGCGLAPSPEILYATTGCYGFPSLVEATYEKISAESKPFRESVAPSAFAHYCNVLLWARLLKVQRLNQLMVSLAEERFIESVLESIEYRLPTPIAKYLNGIGNFSTPSGIAYRWRLPDRQWSAAANVQGWNGRVTAATHNMYEGFPNLGVTAYRMCVDLDQTIPPGPYPLPAAITPAAQPGVAPAAPAQPGLPTTNMLGWVPKSGLRQGQVHQLRQWGVTANAFPSDIVGFPVSISMLNGIAQILATTQSFKLFPISLSASGSAALIAFEGVSRDYEYMPNSGTTQISSPLVLGSSENLSPQITGAAQALVYRFQKRVTRVFGVPDFVGLPRVEPRYSVAPVQRVAVHNAWCCYTWDDYERVPDTWRENANAWEDDLVVNLRTRLLGSPTYLLRQRQLEVLFAM